MLRPSLASLTSSVCSAHLFSSVVPLSRTRSMSLSSPLPADSTSEDDLLSSQSQSTSDVNTALSVDSIPVMSDVASGAPLGDVIAMEAAAATIHIHCPTPVLDTSAAEASELTAEQSIASGSVGWTEVAARSVIHVLPCSIHYNGPAAVQRYFQPNKVLNPTTPPAAAPRSDSASSSSTETATTPTTYISASAPPSLAVECAPDDALLAESRWSIAAFRGRQVTGELVPLPQHTIGLVLRDSNGGGGRGRGRSNGRGSKRRAAARPQSKVHPAAALDEAEDDCVLVGAVDGGDEESAGVHIDWVVDGWFDAVTLWGRDSDWKGADQSVLKRSLLDWPVIAAALHGTATGLSLVER